MLIVRLRGAREVFGYPWNPEARMIQGGSGLGGASLSLSLSLKGRGWEDQEGGSVGLMCIKGYQG